MDREIGREVDQILRQEDTLEAALEAALEASETLAGTPRLFQKTRKNSRFSRKQGDAPQRVLTTLNPKP